MPEDKVRNRTFKDMFSLTVRFAIPFFQRGYVWKRDNWEVLFGDLKEQLIDELEERGIDSAEHFFGPIVVMEQTGTELSDCPTRGEDA